MRALIVFSLLLAFVVTGISPALAYSGETGNRAVDLSGWDIVNQRTARLSDYMGKWVVLEFCATWCGPCMHDFPAFVKNVTPYIDRGDLAVIWVSCDTPETLPDLKRLVRKWHIKFPVLYDGGQFNSAPVVEWCRGDTVGFGIPHLSLINPQGVVVIDDIYAENLPATLDFFMNTERPVVGFRAWHNRNDDGSYTFTADVVNPTREPLEVRMAYYWEQWLCDPNDPQRQLTDIQRHCESGYAKALLEFDEFGEGRYQVTVTPTPQQDMIGYGFAITYPGSSGLPGLSAAGIQLGLTNDYAFKVGVEWKGDHWRVLPD